MIRNAEKCLWQALPDHAARRPPTSEWFGAALIVVGGAIVSYRPGDLTADWVEVLAVTGACLSWGLDNNLTQQVSSYDPISIVLIKTLSAGAGNVLLAIVIWPHVVAGRVVVASLLVGFFCYETSIVLDVCALRFLGAAREAAFFATAPFLGALAPFLWSGTACAVRISWARPLWRSGVLVFRAVRGRG
ncbi:MAG: hypothetical protein ABJA98_12585 [Acidobacteriota bacterium]